MSQFIVDLPEDIAAELKERHIPDEAVSLVVIETIKSWLRMERDAAAATPKEPNGRASRFSESAVPFVDQLIKENRRLFERLARLPDDSA
jgi:hypothetical protein